MARPPPAPDESTAEHGSGRLRHGLLGRLALAAACASMAGSATLPAPALGQGPGMQEMAIEWIRGRFGSPLLCEIDGEAVRGMRRLQIAPGARHVRPPVARVIFVEMKVEEATRCFTDLGVSVPNIRGTLQLRYPGPARPDTASRDFKILLRKNGGLDFDVASGVLRMQQVGAPDDAPRDVDFRGGVAKFRKVQPGSDVERLLSEIQSPRKLDLEIVARDGTTLHFPLFMSDLR